MDDFIFFLFFSMWSPAIHILLSHDLYHCQKAVMNFSSMIESMAPFYSILEPVLWQVDRILLHFIDNGEPC